MKFVIQRVTEASCTVDGNVTGAIQKGFLVLIGIADTDTTAIADKMIKKLKPEMASPMYDYIVARCKEQIPDTGCGIFGADMKISLLNDGPFTILLDSEEIC